MKNFYITIPVSIDAEDKYAAMAFAEDLADSIEGQGFDLGASVDRDFVAVEEV